MLIDAAVFWLGACLGSFLNVVICRLPKDESVVRPRSHCPGCGVLISFYDNVPILSWIFLRGRCRSCRGKISARYPAVELLMAGLCLSLWLRWGNGPWVFSASLAAAGLTAVAFIDGDTFLIPDELSLGLCALGIGISGVNPLLAQESWPWRAAASAGGAAFGFALCWGIAALGERLFKKEAMGGGDIKLLAAIGAWSGVLGVFDCVLIASFAGVLYGGTLMARRKLKRDEPIPFAPFLALGAIANFFYLLPWGFPFLR
ncbi:MAG TPA: prepilin peptidase [Elusimicrobiota bacterium]|nr:prepilin peptidase [Elusimicrobiota bacterium]